MSELSEIRDVVYQIKSTQDSHILETKTFREGEEKRRLEDAKRHQEHHSTLYDPVTGLVYKSRELEEIQKQILIELKRQESHKRWIVTIFGIPIIGWLIEAFLNGIKHAMEK